jgi:putative peptide zinc metalloprotease protein
MLVRALACSRAEYQQSAKRKGAVVYGRPFGARPYWSTPVRMVSTLPTVSATDTDQQDTSLRIAAGVELLGRYEGSGYKEPYFLVRRADGQVIQLPHLLYLVLSAADGKSDLHGISHDISQKVGRKLNVEQLGFLLEKRLRPLGLLQTAGQEKELRVERPDPLLALKFRGALVPERAVNAIAAGLQPLFHTPVVVAVLAGLAAVDGWLFFVHGVAQASRQIIFQPLYLLLTLGLVLLSMAFHECGHAAACRFSGGKPGVMGVGLYMVWPAFYTNVTDAYRLGRSGRLRTDLGGVYFNAVFVLATAAAYFVTGFEPLLVVIVIQHLEILQQFMPFLRLDGYYVVSDLTGVPDLFGRVKPILRSLVPWRPAEPRVQELRPWVRAVVTGWVLLVVPILIVNLALLVLQSPRILATVGDSVRLHLAGLGTAVQDGAILTALMGGISILALVLPVAGLSLTFARIGGRAGQATWRWSEGRRPVRVALVAIPMATVLLVWLPRDAREPIQREERGTVQDVITGHGRGGNPWRSPLIPDTSTESGSADPVASATAWPTTERPPAIQENATPGQVTPSAPHPRPSNPPGSPSTSRATPTTNATTTTTTTTTAQSTTTISEPSSTIGPTTTTVPPSSSPPSSTTAPSTTTEPPTTTSN